MKGAVCLLILSVVGAAFAASGAVTQKARGTPCQCTPEELQDERDSDLRMAWLVLLNYRTKLEINKLEKELKLKKTEFKAETLPTQEIAALNTKSTVCTCKPKKEIKQKITNLREIYLTLFSYKAELDILKLQRDSGLAQTNFNLNIIWPQNIVDTTPTRSRRQLKPTQCSNGCILYCLLRGGVRYNKDGSCTTGFMCQCNGK